MPAAHVSKKPFSVHSGVPPGARTTALLLSFLTALAAGVALAGPSGGRVVAGDGAITASGARTEIHQTSRRLGIEWQEFSIGAGERVHFDQPSRSAVALNRVTGPATSHIEGLLTANGNVFVVNPNGVIFHRSAVVDVGGLLATTHDIPDEDFLAGRYRFTGGGNPAGRVVNEGRISAAQGGLVALVAPSVRNAGVIEARLGRVALAAGDTFTLDLFGDQLVSFAVDSDTAQALAGGTVPVEHSGTIDADGGRVWLTASAARGVVDSAINLTGVVRARTVAQRDGRIVLQGGGSGTVRVAGELDATGEGSAAGGRIEVLGGAVEIAATAKLDASGGAGGGTVLVGGDYQGQGSRQRAARTTVAAGTTIRADATADGDGGTVVVWSDERTVVDGDLSARGGPAGGDGGLVETSSAGELVFNRPVRVGAPAGRAGTWLLDPEDIDIDRGRADSIEATLNEGGNVSIKTSDTGDGEGNITVNASITKTEGEDASLSMSAHNRIEVNKSIRSEAGKLDVSLKAGRAVNVNAGIETNGGRFSSTTTGVVETEPDETVDTATGEEDDNLGGDTQTGEATDDEESESQTVEEDESTEVVETENDDGTVSSSTGETEEAATDDTVAATTSDSEQGESSGDDGESVSESIESTEHVAATGSESGTSETSDMPYILVQDTVATRGGDISLDAGEDGVSMVTGMLDASNTDAGESGGDIEVLGEHVVLAGEAEVDASGDAGGGDVHIGGDYQGQGERRNATTTTVGKHVLVRSDATGDGDAGTVVVWADGTTRFSGHISARGGHDGGDGGTVEVSGKQNLGFWGTVDAGAPRGNAGSLLLDPSELRIIDAIRGQGDQDLNFACLTGSIQSCVLPPGAIIPRDGLSAADLEAFGIDPFPETPLNTVTWDRLIQLANATGFGLYLQADQDITFAPLNGTISTPGSPTGDDSGWTITLPFQDSANTPGRTLLVESLHGDIVFEDRSDNLAVLGGGMRFQAPEGELRLGNLYGIGRPDAEFDGGWSWGYVDLRAGGNIETGAINTRTGPARFADPDTGALIPPELIVNDPTTFNPLSLLLTPAFPTDDPSIFPDAVINAGGLRSDFFRGGPVFITSTDGDIDIQGPVHTASGDFVANAGGLFTAGIIDTGANRVVVKSSPSDPGSLNTLHTGQVDITADTISFNQVNAGRVSLTARGPGNTEDGIIGTVVIDTFRNSDFIGSRPESEGLPFLDPSTDGLALVYGVPPVTPTIDLLFDLADVGQATTEDLNTGDQLEEAKNQLGLGGLVQAELSSDFTFRGGDYGPDTLHVPLAMTFFGFSIVAPPSPVPIEVPLGLPSSSGGTTTPGLLPAGGLPGAAPGNGATPGGEPPSPEITFVESPSSADTERIKVEGGAEQVSESPDGCEDEDRLQWLQRGPRTAARSLDWGRRTGIGTNPADTEDVFKPGNCYFTSVSGG